MKEDALQDIFRLFLCWQFGGQQTILVTLYGKTLREDATRMNDDNQAQVVTGLNNFIVGLASKMGFSNLASARRHFDVQLNLALATVT